MMFITHVIIYSNWFHESYKYLTKSKYYAAYFDLNQGNVIKLDSNSGQGDKLILANRFKNMPLIFHLAPGLGSAWFAIHFDSLLIRNGINQWFGNEWITIHLPLIFDSTWFLIRRLIISRGWFVIRNESKAKWIANQNEKSQMNCESKWIKMNQNQK